MRKQLTMTRARNARAEVSSSAWLRAAVVVVATCGVSLIVRAAYRHCYFAGDDMNLLAEIGLARCGRLSWLGGWTTAIGPHTLILWKALFSLEWMAFGLDPTKFHILAALIHGLSASALFLLCRLWPVSSLTAWTAALSWAGAAVGGWDNPTLWLMCGGMSLALCFFLIAMCFAARGCQAGDRGSVVGMAVFFGLSILTWSDLLLWAPVLLVELSWRGLWSQCRRRIFFWLTAWLVPLVCIGSLLGWLISDEVDRKDWTRGVAPVQVVLRTAGQVAVALGTLTYGDVAVPDFIVGTALQPLGRDEVQYSSAPQARSSDQPGEAGPPLAAGLKGDELLWPKFFLTGLLLGALVMLRKRIEWRLLSLSALMAVAFLFAANAGGFAMSYRDAVNHGHYLYVACLAWCVVAGCLANAICPSGYRPRVAFAALGAPLLLAFFLHQRAVADASARIHDVGFRSSTRTMQGLQSVLTRLSQSGVDQRTIRLPDSPIGLEAGYYRCWPLSAFAALCLPDGPSRLEIVAVQSCRPIDRANAEAVLRSFDDEQALRLAESMSQAYPLLKALLWLDQEANRAGQLIEVPTGMLQLPSGPVALQELWRYEIASSPGSEYVRFRDTWQAGRFREEFPRLALLLHSSTSAEARYLREVFEPAN